ncbi:MAG: type I methionyl aminopeptidase [Coriobacteriales bacterium]|nr:type I methionyl aminopeptidase [Coriobacteriales bacterium]
MINLKSAQDIEGLKRCGALSKEALRLAGNMVKPGISTEEIDKFVEAFIRMHGGIPSFKGLYGFPASICASVNEEIVHGIPSADRILKDGDIISIDTGATVGGWVGDNAWTFAVGHISDEIKALLEVTRDCLALGIEAAVPGNTLGDIGYAVQSHAQKHGYGVVKNYVGHGIGRAMHEDPNVPNYGKPHKGIKLQAGMCIAIEPMITLGNADNRVLRNKWTVVTNDGSPAAHFENTIAITKDGPVITTCEPGHNPLDVDEGRNASC